ncbi:hypothetical protein Q9295_00470 [Xinfangfangia sp. CPCC 101601]|uniref:Uncharacterized protein n=1 Tax=Pseudogemmobacter lacusdianii TaxID=3069608 RepID=A0ABU0VSZ3_9RHOB|nr:hypothetical protein [Xinfangfangia sp. CPCC 101601]MDQ2064833.1 hypothetical protein [Xinfangfangia sp. CPCC 101601]
MNGSIRTILFLLFLANCGASPAPEFFGATRHDVRRDGRDYVIFRKESRVEIIRLGRVKNGDHHKVRATMIALIPDVTGCEINEKSLQGDSGEMRGSLICE